MLLLTVRAQDDNDDYGNGVALGLIVVIIFPCFIFVACMLLSLAVIWCIRKAHKQQQAMIPRPLPSNNREKIEELDNTSLDEIMKMFKKQSQANKPNVDA